MLESQRRAVEERVDGHKMALQAGRPVASVQPLASLRVLLRLQGQYDLSGVL